MKKYKIVLYPNELIRGNTESDLENFRGYLTHNNSLIETDSLVNENNVIQYLFDTENAQITDRFITYLSANTTEAQFNKIYYTSYKVAPILNDFYNKRIRFNIEPNSILLFDALDNTEQVFYKNNNFNFESNKRRDLENKEVLIETLMSSSTISDYYIDIGIDINQKPVFSTDYSKYFKDCVEDGVVLKNCFVDLNRATDPFEYWTNNKSQGKINPGLNWVINKIAASYLSTILDDVQINSLKNWVSLIEDERAKGNTKWKENSGGLKGQMSDISHGLFQIKVWNNDILESLLSAQI